MDAVELLCRGDIEALAVKYGYVFARSGHVVAAIRNDLQRSLATLGASSLTARPSSGVVRAVKYFAPNNTKLDAVIECFVPTDTGRDIMVEFVVSHTATEKHITLEEISAQEPE